MRTKYPANKDQEFFNSFLIDGETSYALTRRIAMGYFNELDLF